MKCIFVIFSLFFVLTVIQGVPLHKKRSENSHDQEITSITDAARTALKANIEMISKATDTVPPVAIDGVELGRDFWKRISEGEANLKSDIELLNRLNEYAKEVTEISYELSPSVKEAIEATQKLLKTFGHN